MKKRVNFLRLATTLFLIGFCCSGLSLKAQEGMMEVSVEDVKIPAADALININETISGWDTEGLTIDGMVEALQELGKNIIENVEPDENLNGLMNSINFILAARDMAQFKLLSEDDQNAFMRGLVELFKGKVESITPTVQQVEVGAQEVVAE